MRRLRRTVSVAAASLVCLVLGTGTALAHVSVDPGTVTAGADAVLTFRVPTESETAKTVKVAVHLPTDHPFPEVHPGEVAGWSVTATTTKLDPPVTEGDVTVTQAVTEVSWSADAGGGIAPEDFEEFAVAVEDVPDTDSLTLPVTQTYSDGSVVEWKDVTPPGGAEPDHPAPVVAVQAAGSSPTSGSDTSVTASTPATVGPTAGVTATATQASPSGTDNAARTLAVIGLITGAMALVVAALGLRRRAAGGPRPKPADDPNGPRQPPTDPSRERRPPTDPPTSPPADRA